MINEVEPPASHAGAGTEASPKQPVAEGLLAALQPFLSEALVSQVGACYQFNVILPSGTQSVYFLDLTTGVVTSLSFPSLSTQVVCALLPWSFKNCPPLPTAVWNDESLMTTWALVSLGSAVQLSSITRSPRIWQGLSHARLCPEQSACLSL